MPNDRTTVTELATALGTLPLPDLAATLEQRPEVLRVDTGTWDRLGELFATGTYAQDFALAYGNGRALLEAPDGLRGRSPRLIEWTGGRRPPGDEVAPIDLRIDHVYLISCKYLSANIANVSPARLFDGLLATTGTWDRGDWYASVAPAEYQTLYQSCRAVAVLDLPPRATELTAAQRRQLRATLRAPAYPAEARTAYQSLCRTVSTASAQRWKDNLPAHLAEAMLWRLLRIGSAPYFLLGARRLHPLRLRVASPWDWRQHYRFHSLALSPGVGGQPQVDWAGAYTVRATGARCQVRGHVEIRWSHGRFAQPPEAKVYLDTGAEDLPGYFPLDDAGPLSLPF